MTKKNENKGLAMSDFNMEHLDTRELEAHIGATIQVGENIAIFGRRGSGKTEIAKQQIKLANKQEVYLNLSVLERVDLAGFPNVLAPERKDGFISYLLPQYLEAMMAKPGAGRKGVVALLDEVDKADPSLWAPLLEFTQFKSINGVKLPNLEAVILTGNLISEGGSRPSLPLLDRAEKYLVSANAQMWLEWAGKDGNIHPAITAYISDNRSDLFGADNPDDRYADPSPRGWTRASAILRKGEELGWSEELLIKKVSGCVGKGVGIRYATYYEHYRQLLPMIASIFKGQNVDKKFKALERGKQLITMMIVSNRLAGLLDGPNANKAMPEISHVGKFFSGDIDPEMLLITIQSQLDIARVMDFDIDLHPDWVGIIKNINVKMEA